MSRSQYHNTRFSGRQDAYLTRIRDITRHLTTGDANTSCPRDGCDRQIQEGAEGNAFVLFCPACGVIFRGSKTRLLGGA